MNSFYVDNTKFEIEDYSKNNFDVKSYDKIYNVDINNHSLYTLIVNNYVNGDYIVIDNYFKNIINEEIEIDKNKIIYIEANEEKKNINTVLKIIDYLNDNNFNKSNKLIVIGGGITQDIGGFTSAIYKRGIKWLYISTTLLSMTDSCIGGKVGINRNNSKNMLGLFVSPYKVIISNYFLNTLSEDMIISGLGESLKLSIIAGDNEVSNFMKLYENKDYLTIIKQSLVIKKAIIEYDELEKNERRILNYGHTFGHAIESATSFYIPHGIAVLFGMLYINKLFTNNFDKINDFILKMIPNKYFINFDNDLLIQNLIKDKKNKGSEICFIIPEKPGNFFIKFIELSNIKDKIINFHF
jgi:3-dehydroquinate synthase